MIVWPVPCASFLRLYTPFSVDDHCGDRYGRWEQ